MPELSCNLRIGPACSEPVQLDDGRILVACETPARDAIHGYLLELEVGRVEPFRLAVLPGGPTDNGTRAQWPRLSSTGVGHGWSDNWVCGYQQGALNAVRRADWGTTFVLSHGIWPICVTNDPTVSEFAWGWKQAPSTTSQGIFGYFADRWWTYDEMRESLYQQEWLKLGTLSHAWTANGVDFYLFKHDSGTLLAESNRVYRVFDGHAEYPRGCTLADGRVLVVAVSQSGTLRVAVSPFQPFQEEEAPVAKVSIEGYALGGTAPFMCGFAYKTEAAVRAWKRVRPVGDLTWQEEAIAPNGTFGSVTLTNAGHYELAMRVEGADGVSAETGMRRVIIVLPPPVFDEPPPSQVISAADRTDADVFQASIDDACHESERAYYNARCAGLDHRAALLAYRDAVSAAIAALEVE